MQKNPTLGPRINNLRNAAVHEPYVLIAQASLSTCALDVNISGMSTLCISDMQFEPLLRYLIQQGAKFKNRLQAQMPSLYVPLKDFVSGVYEKCDAYVLGPYEDQYFDPYTQDVLQSYVADGNALLVAGPDVMPSIFYAPADAQSSPPAPRSPVRRGLGQIDEQEDLTALPKEQQLRDALMAATEASITSAASPSQQRWQITYMKPERSSSNSVGDDGMAVRRFLQLSQNEVNTLPINKIVEKMQALFSNVISNPGGVLQLATSTGSVAGNALVAAQQYINFLINPTSITEAVLLNVVRTVEAVRTSLRDTSRRIAGTELLYGLLDNITALQSAGYGLPPMLRLPPPPTTRPSPPPPYIAPSPPPPPPVNLPSGITYLGCFGDNTVNSSTGKSNTFTIDLGPGFARPNITVNGCLSVAQSRSLTIGGFFIAMQRGFTCSGARDPPGEILAFNQLADSSCNIRCLSEAGQQCGGTILPNGTIPTGLYWWFKVTRT